MGNHVKISALTELTSVSDGDWLPIVDSSTGQTKKVNISLLRPFVDVDGADPTGVDDSTNAIKAAALAAYQAGGGTVYFPPGVYIAEGLPLYPGVIYKGAALQDGTFIDNSSSGPGTTGSIIKLPDSPSDHMFTPDPNDFTEEFIGAGIENLSLYGGQDAGNAPTTQNITGASQADPCQITVTGHGYTTGNKVYIRAITGMDELNYREYTITVVDANNFTLDDEDATGHDAYSSGGTVELVPLYDCINWDLFDGSAAGIGTHLFIIKDCLIRKFRWAYYNELLHADVRDRTTILERNYIWDNFGGVMTNEHVRYPVINDFRRLRFGLGGGHFDAYIIGQNIVSCDIGIQKLETQQGASVGRSVIEANIFGGCQISLALEGNRNSVVGNLFFPDSVGSDCGIRLNNANSINNTITANTFDETDYTWTDGAVCCKKGEASRRNNFSANNFIIRTTAFNPNGGGIQRTAITGNKAVLIASGASFFKSDSAQSFYNNINDNNIELLAAIGTNTDIIAIPNSNGVGNVFVGNMIEGRVAADNGYAFSGDFRSSVFMGNRIRRTDGVEMTNHNSDTVPNASRTGTLVSDSTSDAASVKTMNVIDGSL